MVAHVQAFGLSPGILNAPGQELGCTIRVAVPVAAGEYGGVCHSVSLS
jgi:hypothetical protein